MSDYDSSLPVRTETTGDVDVFVSDSVTPSQKLKIEADGSIYSRLKDENGAAYSETNPLHVTISDEPATNEVHDYNTVASVAAAATSEHTYSVANGDTFILKQFMVSGSGKMKIELQIGDGAASEAFTSKMVMFNSTANPNMVMELKQPLEILGTVNTTTVKIIRTNRDKQPQDVYSTIMGDTK